MIGLLETGGMYEESRTEAEGTTSDPLGRMCLCIFLTLGFVDCILVARSDASLAVPDDTTILAYLRFGYYSSTSYSSLCV